jgi:hypothetical protein
MVIVVARDEGKAIDGSGGSLIRVRVLRESADPPVAFLTDGLGRGAPTFAGADPLWLSWVGPGEHLRLLPLDGAGGPVGPASAEEAMDEARPLIALSNGRLLVATPADSAGPLRAFACTR